VAATVHSSHRYRSAIPRKMEPVYAAALENCIASRILILKNGLLYFKHELYRRTIEASLSPMVRLSLNKKILELLRERFEEESEIERIIHHAKNANEYELVVHYAPIAAREAATVGAHLEASKLYLTAIDIIRGMIVIYCYNFTNHMLTNVT